MQNLLHRELTSTSLTAVVNFKHKDIQDRSRSAEQILVQLN